MTKIEEQQVAYFRNKLEELKGQEGQEAAIKLYTEKLEALTPKSEIDLLKEELAEVKKANQSNGIFSWLVAGCVITGGIYFAMVDTNKVDEKAEQAARAAAVEAQRAKWAAPPKSVEQVKLPEAPDPELSEKVYDRILNQVMGQSEMILEEMMGFDMLSGLSIKTKRINGSSLEYAKKVGPGHYTYGVHYKIESFEHFIPNTKRVSYRTELERDYYESEGYKDTRLNIRNVRHFAEARKVPYSVALNGLNRANIGMFQVDGENIVSRDNNVTVTFDRIAGQIHDVVIKVNGEKVFVMAK